MSRAAYTITMNSTEICARCAKPEGLCVCDAIQRIDNRLFVLILQHPQEKREVLATAPLLAAALAHVKSVVGLSWPNLRRVLGRDVDARRWGVLYLGSTEGKAPLAAVDRKGKALAHQEALLHGLEGLIVLDGSWSQAKALWWRNPWLLKCTRLVLNAPFASRYGKLRREPRRDSLSSLESVAFALAELEGDPAIFERLLKPFEALLDRYKQANAKPAKPTAPQPQ
jgi:DTW domain-containing protein YfiP